MMRSPLSCLSIVFLSGLLAGSLQAEDLSDAPVNPPPLPDEVSLQLAIDYALTNSLPLLQAKERLQEELGLMLEVTSGSLPQVSLNGRLSDQADELIGFQNANSDDWTVFLQVRQALYAGGRLHAATEAQKLTQKAAVYDVQAQVEQTIQNVRIRYYDVLLARGTIAVEEQNVELLEEQFVSVQNRFDAGSVSNFDVLQARVSLANAKPALIRARNNFRVAVAELKQAVGYIRTEDYVVDPPTFLGELEANPQPYNLLTALEASLQQRAELKRLQLVVDSTAKRLEVAEAGSRPSVDLVGRYDVRRSYDAGVDVFEEPESGWFLGVEGSWSLWDGRNTKGRVAQVESQLRQAQLAVKEASLAVEIEVRRSYSELQSATELLTAAREVTGQAEEALRLANERYDVGSATVLETLQARSSLTEARNNELQANYSYLVALATFRRAVGGTEEEWMVAPAVE